MTQKGDEQTAFYLLIGPILTGKVAIVTGAAQGIGLGCARVLGAAGAAMAVIDLNQGGVVAAAEVLQAEGIKTTAFTADVRDSSQINSVVQAVIEQFGHIDILVNNAGTHDGKGVEHSTESDWDRIIDTNLKSVYLMTKTALPALKEARGAVVNMASMVGLVGQASSGAYTASKGGIVAITKSMAIEFAPYGIRVNAICPGWVNTPLVDWWFKSQPDETAARRYIADIHPLGRIASINEIGQVALFLVSEQSSFITGVALPVDGGVTLGY